MKKAIMTKINKFKSEILKKSGIGKMPVDPCELQFPLRIEKVVVGDIHFMDSCGAIVSNDIDLAKAIEEKLFAEKVKVNKYHTDVAAIDIDRGKNQVMPSILSCNMTQPMVLGVVDGIEGYYCVSGRNRLANIISVWDSNVALYFVVVEFPNEKALVRAIDDANNTRNRNPLEKQMREVLEEGECVNVMPYSKKAAAWIGLCKPEAIGLEPVALPFELRRGKKNEGNAPLQQGAAQFVQGFVDYKKGMCKEYFKMQLDVAAKIITIIERSYHRVIVEIDKQMEVLSDKAMQASQLPQGNMEYRELNTKKSLLETGRLGYIFSAHPMNALGRVTAWMLYDGVEHGKRVLPPDARIEEVAKKVACAAMNVVTGAAEEGRSVSANQVAVLVNRLIPNSRKKDVFATFQKINGPVADDKLIKIQRKIRDDKDFRSSDYTMGIPIKMLG